MRNGTNLHFDNKDTSNVLYLDLLKKCLMGLVYTNTEYSSVSNMRGGVRRLMGNILRPFGLELVERISSQIRKEGRDWPRSAHTMIGQKRLDNVQFCVEKTLKDHVLGDFIETGVWRGGACILMRGILKAHGAFDRAVWVADSFEGLPRPTHEQDKNDPAGKHYKDKELSVSLENVQANFASYGLLDEQVRFLKGWFSETLPTAPIKQLAVIRLDGDLYESTMDALVNLYPKLSVGGYLIVDDYSNIPACKQAVTDYREKHGIHEPIIEIDWTGVYWQRKQK